MSGGIPGCIGTPRTWSRDVVEPAKDEGARQAHRVKPIRDVQKAGRGSAGSPRRGGTVQAPLPAPARACGSVSMHC